MTGEINEQLIQRQVGMLSEFDSVLPADLIPLTGLRDYIHKDPLTHNRSPFILGSGIMYAHLTNLADPNDRLRRLFGVEPTLLNGDRISDIIKSYLTSAHFKYFGWSLITDVLVSSLDPTFTEPIRDKFQLNPNSRRLGWGDCAYAEDSFASALEMFDSGLQEKLAFFCDEKEEPVIAQKIGTDVKFNAIRESTATAIALRPLSVQGILVPAGTLLGIRVDDERYIGSNTDRLDFTSSITGVTPLRFSTMVIDEPDEALVTFGKQYATLRNECKGGVAPTVQSFIDYYHNNLRPYPY